MTLPEVADLTSYWERHPPEHLLLASFVGWKVPGEKQRQQPFKVSTREEAHAAYAAFRGG